MRIKKTMNTQVEAFHDFIKRMIIQDVINTSDNKTCHNLADEDIKKGFQYSKRILNKTGKEGLVNVCIESLEPGLYEVSFTSKNGVNTVRYSYTMLDSNTIDLVYEEYFESDAKLKNMNHSFMSTFYKRSNRKRIEKTLNHIEQLLVKQPV